MVTGEAQIGWQDYLEIILRRRWFFIVPCVAIVAVSMGVGMVLPKIYRANTVVLVQSKGVMNPLMRGLAVTTPVQEQLRVLREEMLSWVSLSRLVHELGMDRQASNPLAFEKLIKRLQEDIVVKMRGRELVLISYEDPDPRRAQQLVNTITKIYMDRTVELQGLEADTAISFIEGEMAIYEKELAKSERALREFKELYVMQMPVATELNEQVISLEVYLAQLLVEDTEEHPSVVRVERQINDLKQRRNSEIKRVITTALARGHDPEFYQELLDALEATPSSTSNGDPTVRVAQEAYEAWVERMESSSAATDSDAPQVQVVAITKDVSGQTIDPFGGSMAASLSLAPREQQELAHLTRDYGVHGRTYHRMQERLETAKITQRLGESDEGTKFKIIEPARLPLKPVRPHLGKIFVFSLLLAIFVGFGVAFLAEYFDQSFQTGEELQAALEVPVLGSISTIVTEEDAKARRRRWRGWVTFRNQLNVLKKYVLQPLWGRMDRVLVRWGL